jgi:hypothetical protein
MKIIQILENDWKLINYQQDKINKFLENHNIYIIFHPSINPLITLVFFILIAIGLGIALDKYSYHISLLWLSIPFIGFFIRILKLKLSISLKILLVYFAVFISIILIFKKDIIGDFIGNDYIKGYSSWYEDGFDINTETEQTNHYFKTDKWIGSFLLNCFNFLYFPFLLLVPYITWKQVNELISKN